jgi:hypothetical protein
MEAAVQRVQVSWTKQSRGGSAASLRSAAPTAFPLPSMPAPFVHEVVMREHDGFQPQFMVQEGLVHSGSDAGVLLRQAGGLLGVQVEALHGPLQEASGSGGGFGGRSPESEIGLRNPAKPGEAWACSRGAGRAAGRRSWP